MAKKVYKTSRKFHCPYCGALYPRMDLIDHVNKEHESLIPEGYSATRVVYEAINKTDHGICMICKKNVYEWNEKTSRYNNLCDNPKCREEVRRIALERHVRVYNKPSLLDDPEHQEKMLGNRRISGKYRHSDGAELTYTGRYEKAAVEFMDKVMNIPSKDIQMPGPVLEYEFEGETHHWITDIYYIPANLIIEVKDGGDNPNKRNMPVYRGKQAAKEVMITNLGKFNYLRLTNNNFSQLLEALADIKYENLDQKEAAQVKYYINESTEVLNEKVLRNTEDIYWNKDKFDSGEINLCFITGLSGSGKSTMGRDMQKDGIEHYELDDVCTNWNFSDDNLKEYGDLIYSFFKGPGKKYRYYSVDEFLEDEEWDGKDGKDDGYEPCVIRAFVKYAMSYAKAHKDTKFVLEGVWMFLFFEPSYFKDYAFYIKGTSMIISNIRGAKRDIGNQIDKDEHPFKYMTRLIVDINKHWLYYIKDELKIRKFVDYYSKLVKSIDEEVGGIPASSGRYSTFIIPYMMHNAFDIAIGCDKDDEVLVTDDGSLELRDLATFEDMYHPSQIMVYDDEDAAARFEDIKANCGNIQDALKVLTGHKIQHIDELMLCENLKLRDFDKEDASLDMIYKGVIRENEILSGAIKVHDNPTAIKGHVILAKTMDGGCFIHTPNDYYLSSDIYPTPEDIPQNVIDTMEDLYVNNRKEKE